MCVNSHAPNRKRQITISLTGHSRIVCPQYWVCLMSPFWLLEFGVASRVLKNLWNLVLNTFLFIRIGTNVPLYYFWRYGKSCCTWLSSERKWRPLEHNQIYINYQFIIWSFLCSLMIVSFTDDVTAVWKATWKLGTSDIMNRVLEPLSVVSLKDTVKR
jgi:hypothetical protein